MSSGQMENRTVLVVDDELDVRQAVADLIAGSGIPTLQAADAAEALRQVAGGRVALVLTDIAMPGMSGLELLAQLNKQGFKGPTILMSGFATKDAAIRALRLRAFDFLEKPLDQASLMDVIQRGLAAASNWSI